MHRIRHWIARFAILAVLANALAPAISQARAASRSSDSPWMEVCTATGSSWVRLDDQGRLIESRTTQPDDAPASQHGPACAFCVPHAGSFAMLVEAPAVTFDSPDLHQVWRPQLGLTAPRARTAWSWPALRGPPLRDPV